MTKKHFEAIARILSDRQPEWPYDTGDEHRADELQTLAILFAAYFASLNSRFDRSHFLTACGLEN